MKIWPALLLCLVVAGCAKQELGGSVSYSSNIRAGLQSRAEAGDSNAQFELGNAYCCGDGTGFWSTPQAVSWWCRAAAQAHEGAKAKLQEHNASCTAQTP